jgi:hypothetical protein
LVRPIEVWNPEANKAAAIATLPGIRARTLGRFSAQAGLDLAFEPSALVDPNAEAA